MTVIATGGQWYMGYGPVPVVWLVLAQSREVVGLKLISHGRLQRSDYGVDRSRVALLGHSNPSCVIPSALCSVPCGLLVAHAVLSQIPIDIIQRHRRLVLIFVGPRP